MSENKRYVVQMEMYVYADNDYMAKKRMIINVKNVLEYILMVIS